MSSSYLFARPSFLEGWGRIFDWGGALNQYNFSLDGDEADRRALAGDWQTLMDDFDMAFSTYLTRLSPAERAALEAALDQRELTTGVTEESRQIRAFLLAEPSIR